MDDSVFRFRMPKALAKQIEDLINIEGFYVSKSDALRHGARLVVLFAKGTTLISDVKKEVREKL